MHEDLIKRLRDKSIFFGQIEIFDQMQELLLQAADAIEELQKQRDEWESHAALAESFARGWIPVTERLPEKDVRVIVCASLPEGVHSDFIYEDGHWFVSTGVTHWMPLPEPPKEE